MLICLELKRITPYLVLLLEYFTGNLKFLKFRQKFETLYDFGLGNLLRNPFLGMIKTLIARLSIVSYKEVGDFLDPFPARSCTLIKPY